MQVYASYARKEDHLYGYFGQEPFHTGQRQQLLHFALLLFFGCLLSFELVFNGLVASIIFA